MRVLALPFLLLACSDDPGGGGPNVDSHVNFFDLPGYAPPKLDVLVVVDDTTAMAPYQAQLDAVPAAAETALVGVNGSQPDVRIAVTTTAGAGTLRPTGLSDPFIAQSFDVRYRPTTNYTGSLAAAFGPLLDVGATSTSPTKPLEAAKAALAANPTFLRDSSYFALVVMTVGDDTSSESVATYASGFKASRADSLNFLFSASYDPPATRLDAFAAELPNRAFVNDVTTTQLSDTFLFANLSVRTVLGVPCVRVPLDVDAATAGDQYECDINAYYEDDSTEVFRQCTAGMTEPCYAFEIEPLTCSEAGYGELVVRNFPSRYRPTIRGQCVVEGSE